MRRLLAIALLLFGLAAFAAPAVAEKRVALVIGNSAYKNVGLLANPANDATAMAALLKSAGFAVTELRDAGLTDFKRAVSDFSETASDADIAVVYFAGHGIEVDRANYLIPVDARLARDFDVADETVALDRVLQAIEPAKRLRLVILDACRTNPFIGSMRRSNRSVGRGLVRVEPATADTLVAFAAKENTVADDGAGKHSPFTAALLNHLTTPGLDIRLALGRVRDEVRTATQRKQEPFVYGSLGGQNVAIVSAPAAGAPSVVAPATPVDPDAAARRDFEFAERQNSKEVWEEFLRKHPTGIHAAAARQRLALLVPSVQPATPPPLVQPTVGVLGVTPLSAERERALKPKDIFKECDACPEMVVVPVGSFAMGSPASEKDRAADEGPQHWVTFSRQFAVGKFAVTFDEWDACVADGGCNGYRPDDSRWGRGRQPVINVSWHDAKAYVAWLSRKTGKTYRLLSEAEREYVTRAGTTTPFWTGASISKSQANFDGSSPVSVDSFKPNPWDLHQVHGNVWEWTEDCWNESYSGAPSDGSAWTSGYCGKRVLRGGSFLYLQRSLRSAIRYQYASDNRGSFGFRVARTLEQIDVPPQRTEVPPPSQLAVVAPPGSARTTRHTSPAGSRSVCSFHQNRSAVARARARA